MARSIGAFFVPFNSTNSVSDGEVRPGFLPRHDMPKCAYARRRGSEGLENQVRGWQELYARRVGRGRREQGLEESRQRERVAHRSYIRSVLPIQSVYIAVSEYQKLDHPSIRQTLKSKPPPKKSHHSPFLNLKLSFFLTMSSNQTTLAPPSETSAIYTASCHCAAFIYTITTSPPLSCPSARISQCNCSICIKNGYLMIYPPNSAVTFVKGSIEEFEVCINKTFLVILWR
jgi:hypothetical protein